jgi:anti-sigma factor RsiW
MRCTEMAPLIQLMTEGNLPQELYDRVQKHLMRCPSCAHEAYSLQHARDVLRQAYGNLEAPASFRERTLAKLYDHLAEQIPQQHPAAENQPPLPNVDLG